MACEVIMVKHLSASRGWRFNLW